jgi:hypothetical protein
MDANVVLQDEEIGKTEIDISGLEIGNVLKKTITFPPHNVRASKYILIMVESRRGAVLQCLHFG